MTSKATPVTGAGRQQSTRFDWVARRVGSRLSLAMTYFLVSLIVLLVGMLVVGVWVGDQIESGVLNRTAAITGLYVDSVITPYIQSLAQQPTLPEPQIEVLDNTMTNTLLGERIVAFRVWTLDGTIVYSPNRQLIGQHFAVEDGLASAAAGMPSAEMTNLSGPENVFERQHWSRLLEVYVPIRERGSGRLIGVTEFYQLPDDLDREVTSARLRSWAFVAGVFFLTYLALAGIVRRGSNTIVRQQAALRDQVTELSRLLQQNRRLRDRLQQAAGRATTLNEQALRRISADLHDGPSQALALALLRLDAAREQSASGIQPSQDFDIVHGALSGALREIRVISAGLRLPELTPLTVRDVVDRVVSQHRQLTGSDVAVHIDHVPDQIPDPIKIALFRSLQEALSNAARHGQGNSVSTRVSADRNYLMLIVSDNGPGFDAESVGTKGRLGLAGMREQAELLGGSFMVETKLGDGTTLRLRWSLVQLEEDWPTLSG